MKDTIRVLAIAPYEGLAHLLKLIGNQYDMLHLDIFVGDLEQGLTIARSHLPSRYDAVISRGGTADRIRCITPLPVIDISFSVYDILRSLKLAENYAQNYAFVGFQSIIDTLKTFYVYFGFFVDLFSLQWYDDRENNSYNSRG